MVSILRGSSVSSSSPQFTFEWGALIMTLSLLLLIESRWGVFSGTDHYSSDGWREPDITDTSDEPFLPRAEEPREPAQVYLDIGSNNGLSILRFLGVPGVSSVYDPLTPPRFGAWHVVMMEANPVHTERLEAMARDVESFEEGHKAQLHVPLALSTEDGGTITFFLDSWQSGTYAATTVAGALSSSGEEITVPTVNLERLCKSMVLGGLTAEDYVVVKMDVEGSEYDILLQAIEAGLPELWDELYVEFHHDNPWVLKGTPMEVPAKEKFARIIKDMQELFGLRVGIWDRRRLNLYSVMHQRDGEGRPPPLRIDCHTHILPESLPNWSERFGYGGFVRLGEKSSCGKRAMMVRDDGTNFREVEDSLWSVSRRLSDCKGVGVDAHVLSTVPVMFNYWAKGEDTVDLARTLNDHMVATVAQAPEHFVGLGTLPMQSPELAIGELRRCMRAGLAGVQIGSHVSHMLGDWGGVGGKKEWRHWPLSSPELFKVFQVAEELGACLFVHPWDMIGAELMGEYFLPWLVGMPAETTLAICSLMFSGVLERLPNLRVCFAHGGGAFASTLGRVEHGWHVRPDLCQKHTTWSPKEHLSRKRVWVDSLVHEPMALQEIVRTYGSDRVCEFACVFS